MSQINDYMANFMLPTVQMNYTAQPSISSGMDSAPLDFQALLMQKIAMAQQMNQSLGQPNQSQFGGFPFPMMMGQQMSPLQTENPFHNAAQAYNQNNMVQSPTQLGATDSVLRKQPPTDAYNGLIKQAANKYGIDENLIHSIIKMESNYNPNTKSHAGAVGLMQLMPITAKTVGVTDRWDNAQNIDGGTHYFSKMLREQGGDVKMALAAYNAGPGNVKKYGGVPPFKETQNYIRKVMDYYNA